MSLVFGVPAALWALAALALPLLLHLVRRERQQRTVFAALAWLSPRQRPRRRLRFERWLLLALRLALLAALALLLAQPRLLGAPAPARVSLWHPEVAVPDAAAAEGESRHWLAPGLPAITQPAGDAGGDVASLLRDADATLPPDTRLEVHLPAVIGGLDAEPLRLSRAVGWRVHETSPAPAAAANAMPASPRIALRGDADHPSRRWLRALQAAWAAPATPEANAAGTAGIDDDAGEAGDRAPHADADRADLPAPGTWLAWTSPQAPDASLLAWVADGGRLVLDVATPWPLSRAPAPLDAEGWLQGAGHGRGRVLQWRVPLAPDTLPALLEPGFPTQLRQVLETPPAPAYAHTASVTPTIGAAAPVPPPRSLDTPLLWLVAALFALERLLALRARRPEAA